MTKGPEGIKLRFYLFCLFATNDPTLLHSWSKINYLTLSPANLPPHPTRHVGNGPRPLHNSKSRSNTPKHSSRASAFLSPPACLDLRQVRNTPIPLLALPLCGLRKAIQFLKPQRNKIITDSTTQRATEIKLTVKGIAHCLAHGKQLINITRYFLKSPLGKQAGHSRSSWACARLGLRRSSFRV